MSISHAPEHDTSSGRRVIEMKRSIGPRVPAVVPFAFGVYAVLLVALTLCKGYLSLGGVWNTGAHHQRSLDLVLFNGFSDAPIWWGPWANTIGNVALFLPFGFLLLVVLRSRSRFPLLEVIAYSALVSLIIEVAQFVFAVGYTDVDDLLLNTIGGALGALIALKAPRDAVKGLCWTLIAGCVSILGLMVTSSLR
ncbi:VanZ family protein [Corynebacterium pacaense]|uniref:VanZ family protein n=1 Tax=Corynebacterium pacaense TaxID=1816684 RepID=UPI0009BBAD04|nr:VanZ family protein [Corynebacterium pacaense]